MTHVVRTSPITLEEYEDYLRSWHHVPYRDGGMSRQGVNCLNFVVLIADWLHGWDTAKLPKVPVRPKQTSLHNKTEAFRIIKWVRNRYNGKVVWRANDGGDPPLLPADVLVCKNQVHPGHGLIAGTRQNELWHAFNGPTVSQGGEVFSTALSQCQNMGMIESFRSEDILLCL